MPTALTVCSLHSLACKTPAAICATAGDAFPPPDPHSGIVQRRLSNGIAINYRYTDNEPRSGLLRLIANGGRIAERPGVGDFGRVVVGTRTLSESGAVGPWAREQVRPATQ
mgnify:CR=1 FL=1